MTVEEVKLECLREAVKVYALGTGKGPVELAREFANFVLGFTYDEEADEWVEPDEDDDSALKSQVRAFDDDGQEL